jgi:hypothetical protein
LPPPPAAAPKIERRERAGLEIVRAYALVKVPHIEAPSRKAVEFAVSPDVQSQKEARRRTHTRSTSSSLFGTAAFSPAFSIKLYRRFIANGRHAPAGLADLSVLQHRISTILLRFNVYTDQ